MVQLYQSNLLQALGWALANSLWQMSLLWLAHQLLITIPFRRRPDIKHAGAFLMLSGGAVWFIASFVQRLQSLGSVTELKPEATTYALPHSLTNWLEGLLPYFSTAYLVVLVFLVIRFIMNVMGTRRLRLDVSPAPDWQHVVNKLTVSMGLSREVMVYVSEHILVPSTVGFLKPVILLPIATVNQLSVEQVESVIMHEMAHIRRNDFLINLIVAFIEVILFFNPFAHLLARAIRKECELCCDDVVLKKRDAEGYAQALLLLEKAKLRPALAVAATGRQGMLLGRVKRILKVPDQEVTYRDKIFAFVLVAGMVMAASLLAPKELSRQEIETTAKVRQFAAMPAETPTPLPFIRKISPVEQTHNNTTPKAGKLKTGSPVTTKAENSRKTTVAAPKSIIPPVAPAPPQPPTPPSSPEEFEARAWQKISEAGIPFMPAEMDMLINSPNGGTAPDPRDRRSPSILRSVMIAKAVAPLVHNWDEESANLRSLARINSNKALVERSLIKVKKDKEKAEREFFQFHSGQAAEVFAQAMEEQSRVTERRKNQGRKIIKEFPGEDGMTIILRQEGAEIEITVKDSR